MLTKEKVWVLYKFSFTVLQTGLAKRMKLLFLGEEVFSGKRKGQVCNFPVTIHFRKGFLQALQIHNFSQLEILS